MLNGLNKQQLAILTDIYRAHPEWREQMLQEYGEPSPEQEYWRERLVLQQMLAEPPKLLSAEELARLEEDPAASSSSSSS